MKYRIRHRTVYEYEAPVTVSHHAARLQPRHFRAQQREEFRLEIRPPPAVRTARVDYFGNDVCFFSIQELHSRLEITSTSQVRVEGSPPAPGLSPPWETVVALFRGSPNPESLEAWQFVFDSQQIRCSAQLAAFARPSFEPGRPLLAAVEDLNLRIFRNFKYDKAATTVSTPVEEFLVRRRGVCQDFAHFAIAGLRSLGLPARYVSGYLRTRRSETKEQLIGTDASHAWFSVFCPGYGWVDYDPTNNLMPETEHITVAYGRDFNDVSPVSGMIVGGGAHTVQVAVSVESE